MILIFLCAGGFMYAAAFRFFPRTERSPGGSPLSFCYSVLWYKWAAMPNIQPQDCTTGRSCELIVLYILPAHLHRHRHLHFLSRHHARHGDVPAPRERWELKAVSIRFILSSLPLPSFRFLIFRSPDANIPHHRRPCLRGPHRANALRAVHGASRR